MIVRTIKFKLSMLKSFPVPFVCVLVFDQPCKVSYFRYIQL